MTHPDGMRILWQSGTALERFPAYAKAIRSHARERCAAGTVLELRGVSDRAHGSDHAHDGAAGLDTSFDFKRRALIDSAQRAEREGYDAVALGCFLDPALDELKQLLAIPVLGLAETALHLACTLGRRFAVLSHDLKFQQNLISLISKYGLEQHCGPLMSLEMQVEQLEAGLSGNPAACLERIQDIGRQAVAQGAEVILLGCGLMNLVGIRNGLSEIDGAPILDISGALLKMTEAMVVLRRTSGLHPSRNGDCALPAGGAGAGWQTDGRMRRAIAGLA
jgi:allantoin racemase